MSVKSPLHTKKEANNVIRFVSFRFVSFRFVSFRFVSFRFVSFRFVSPQELSLMLGNRSVTSPFGLAGAAALGANAALTLTYLLRPTLALV
jgi:hypothetical protein